jgi:hypothetical protein
VNLFCATKSLFIRLIIRLFQLIFFSQNSIFLSQQISQQCFSAGSPAERGLIISKKHETQFTSHGGRHVVNTQYTTCIGFRSHGFMATDQTQTYEFVKYYNQKKKGVYNSSSHRVPSYNKLWPNMALAQREDNK